MRLLTLRKTVNDTVDILNEMALLLPSRLDALTHSISADVLTGLERESTKIKGWMAMLEVRLVSFIILLSLDRPTGVVL